MEKGVVNKTIVLALISVLLVSCISYSVQAGWFADLFAKITGKVTGEKMPEDAGKNIQFGPTEEEQKCMMTCMGCSSPGVGCTGNQQECQTKCNVQKPEQTEEEQCVETCAKKGCGEYDFPCQEKNQAVCDKECGMIKEPEAKSEEEQCIRDCVNKESQGLICRPGEGGEKGNEICQRCAKSCEYLYEGPCLTEMELEEAKKTCDTCEHCYGAPVMGDSGEGYECIVSIECKDASSEFGDNPGTGPGIIEKTGEVIGNAFKGVANFFKNMFGGEDKESENEEGNNAMNLEEADGTEYVPENNVGVSSGGGEDYGNVEDNSGESSA